ncbi:MAG TPA: hypothetical protein VFE31_04920 [Opitutaceae bacterium]|jgi:hypothetical protein|nr:hypothetical protein [Opitutaceae bacterium]
MRKRLVLVAALALAASGCAVLRVREAPNAKLGSIKHPFVVSLLTDGRGVDAAITRELRRRGYDATYGAATEMPDNADARILYQDRWQSDFTTYMISIQIEVRTARTDYPLALAYAERPSIFGQDKTVMIDKVLNKLFPAKHPLPILPPLSDTPDFGNNVAPPPQ